MTKIADKYITKDGKPVVRDEPPKEFTYLDPMYDRFRERYSPFSDHRALMAEINHIVREAVRDELQRLLQHGIRFHREF